MEKIRPKSQELDEKLITSYTETVTWPAGIKHFMRLATGNQKIRCNLITNNVGRRAENKGQRNV